MSGIEFMIIPPAVGCFANCATLAWHFFLKKTDKKKYDEIIRRYSKLEEQNAMIYEMISESSRKNTARDSKQDGSEGQVAVTPEILTPRSSNEPYYESPKTVYNKSIITNDNNSGRDTSRIISLDEKYDLKITHKKI